MGKSEIKNNFFNEKKKNIETWPKNFQFIPSNMGTCQLFFSSRNNESQCLKKNIQNCLPK